MPVHGLRRLRSERSGSAAFQGSDAAYAVKLITEASDFARLRTSWNAVAALSRVAKPFACHEWFDAAWQWRQQTARLYLLCLFDNQKLVAVLPLVMDKTSKWGITRRELSFLTVPDTQACDLLAAEPDRAAAAKAFADELDRRQDEWDVIRLKHLAPGTIAASTLRDALVKLEFSTWLQQAPGNPFIPLDSTWEAFYATRSRSLKKANNLAANRLKKAGNVTIERLGPGTGELADLERFLDCAIGISARSWKTRTGNSLNNAGPESFIRRLSHHAHERRWLSIWILKLNDRALAMEYQLVADNRIYALRSDFVAELADISPGTYLNRCLLEQLFGVGLERYYLGPGDNIYKHRWTGDVEPVEALTVYGRSVIGRWSAAWETSLKPRARALRDRLRAASSNEAARKRQ